jgi:hypothetical protein
MKIKKTEYNKLKKLVRLLVKEAVNMPTEAPPAPTKPVAPPSTPTTPKPTRRNPLLPKPGQKPRPKANVAIRDLDLFINARKQLDEKIETDVPNVINPDIQHDIEGKLHYIEKIFPDLGPNANRYLEIITSESYQSTFKKLSNYLNISHDSLEQKLKNLPSFFGLLIGLIQETLDRKSL